LRSRRIAGRATITFGIGDVLGVTIFEAASGGLFIPAEGGVRPIPNQAVDIHGNISIPYAGSIRANGRTQVEVQDAIVAALKNRAIRATSRCVLDRTKNVHDQHFGRRTLGADSRERHP
jgi:protein involved in polysaccharide export with SLBB domain